MVSNRAGLYYPRLTATQQPVNNYKHDDGTKTTAT